MAGLVDWLYAFQRQYARRNSEMRWMFKHAAGEQESESRSKNLRNIDVSTVSQW